MSVKWNREEVERLKDVFDSEVARLNTEKNKRRDELHTEIIKIIKHRIKGISLNDAKKIFNNAIEATFYQHDYDAIIIEIERIIDVVDSIVNHKND